MSLALLKVRIDQFLWYIRIFKTRSLATLHCKKGMVKVNNKLVKPSYKISLTDAVEIRKNQFWHKIQVLDFPNSRVNAKMVGLYSIYLNDKENLETLKTMRLIQSPLRRKGSGRPNKKERRKINSITEN